MDHHHIPRDSADTSSQGVIDTCTALLEAALNATPPEEMLRLCLRRALDLSASTSGFIARRAGGDLVILASLTRPEGTAMLACERLPFAGPFKETLADGAPLNLGAPTERGRLGLPSGHPEVQTLLGVPFAHGEALEGLIVVANREGAYTVREERLLEGLARLAALVLDTSHAEPSLQESELKYRSLFTCAGDAIFLVEGYTFIDCNPQTLALFGCRTREEILGRTPMDFSPPCQPDGSPSPSRAQALMDAALRGEPQSFEWRHTRLDGSPFEAEVTFSRLDLGGRPHLQAIVRDITQRTRAQEELARNQQLLKGIINNSSAVIYVKDPRGRYLMVNQGYERLQSGTADQIIGRSDYDLYPPDTARTLQAHDLEVMRSGTTLEYDEEIPQKDGIHIYVTLKFPLRDPSGEIYAICGISTDITERRRQKEELIESRNTLQTVLDNVYDAVVIHDPKGDILEVNQKMCMIFGLDTAAALKLNVDDISAPESPRERLDEIWQAVLAGEDRFFEWQCRRPSEGTTFPVEVYLTRLLRRGGPVILATVRDITQHKQAQQDLREREETFRALAENSPDVIMRFDRQHRHLYANPAVKSQTGLDPQAFIGKTHSELGFPRDLVELWDRAIEGVFQSAASRRMEFRLPGGSWIDWLLVPELDARGAVKAVMGAARDITQRKHDEQEKLRLEEMLRQSQKMEAIGRLAGGVAHDFNNLLTGIIGYAEMIKLALDPQDPHYDKIEEIRKAGSRAADLTRQLLAFSRKQMISPRVIDLNQAVSQAQQMIERLIGEDIELVFAPGDATGQVKIDPAQVDQILINLAANARDAMPEGGRLSIETAPARGRHSAGGMVGEYIRLSVSDTGCGIDEEDREHIFEPFFTTKEMGKGTGLGLATVYGIVTQNRGFIEVHSIPGEGTTFHIFLPRIAGEAIQPALDKKTIPQGYATILLVEDDDLVRALAENILTRHGYAVLSAPGVEEAAAISREHPGRIDLLLTDVVMPRMNGRELAGRLQQGRPELRVLFMSGFGTDIMAHHGVLDAGTPFINKPFTIEALTRKVSEVLEG